MSGYNGGNNRGYNRGYSGGFDFDTTSGNVRSDVPGESRIMYDDMNYYSTGQVRRRYTDQPRSSFEEVEFEDDFDDYPADSRTASRSYDDGSALEDDFGDDGGGGGFDDDGFDDDGFGGNDDGSSGHDGHDGHDGYDGYDGYDDERDAAARQGRRRGSGLGYSSYDGDYTEEDYASEFAGIRGLSKPEHLPEKKPVPPERKRGRDNGNGSGKQRRAPSRQDSRPSPKKYRDEYEEPYDDEEFDDPDGYYGRATMRDIAYEGTGVPKIFADYFHDDDEYDDYDEYNRVKRKPIRNKPPVARVRQNTHLSLWGIRRSRIIAASIAVLFAAGAAALGITYLSYFRSTSPLNVSTALTSMEGSVSSTLLKSSVDQQLAAKTIPVVVNGVTSVMSLADCEFQFSTEEDGTERKEWGKTVTGSDIEYTYMTKGSVRFNETKVKDFLHMASGAEGIRMIEPDYKVDIRQDKDTKAYTGTLRITAGSNGYGVDFNSFITELLEHISTDNFSPISAELTNTIAPAVDIDKIYKNVHAVAADAYKVTDGAGNVTYEQEIIGVDFDRNAAAEKIAAGGTEWLVNLALTIPKVTKKGLMAETFPDLLATYSTSFNAGNQARASNLALAGDYINGTILQPGDVFSYNKTVGERTKERGFCKATVYSSEGTDEDYGGGICQTSSTLFYCAMKANLELVKRSCHLYTVSYMVDDNGKPNCFGNDATVNWGTTDMQFRNNKEYPIKLECITKNGVITFNIWGTWDGYTAEYRYVEKATERYPIVYRKYKEGKKNQAGQLGREIWTYRVVFYQETPGVGEREEVDRYREFISKYRPLSQVKYVSSPPAGKQFDVSY